VAAALRIDKPIRLEPGHLAGTFTDLVNRLVGEGPHIDWEGNEVEVPLSPESLDMIDLMEAVAARWGVEIPQRPTAGSIASEALLHLVCKAKRPDALKAIAEATEAELCILAPLAVEGRAGNLKLARWRLKAIETRAAELQGGRPAEDVLSPAEESAIPNSQSAIESGVCKYCGCTEERACTRGGQPCSWTDQSKTVCSACQTLMIEIAKAKRPAAALAIDECTSVALLKLCEDGGLKGDWRRAMVARKIGEISKQ